MLAFWTLIRKLSPKHWVLVVAATALVSAWLIILTESSPRLPSEVANGTYVNSEGAAITLRDGQLSAGDGVVRYVVETDKEGQAYVLLNGRLIINGDRMVHDRMMSYLDRSRAPSEITLWMSRGTSGAIPRPIVFRRQSTNQPYLAVEDDARP